MDLVLSQTQSGYLALLQRYTRALRARNALLKQSPVDLAALEGFSRELVQAGEQLIRYRSDLLPLFAPVAEAAYRRVSNEAEALTLQYRPAVKRDFTLELAQAQPRERALRSTLVGPHRDELNLVLNDKSAAQFGSEGQKRTLAIALKMAQAEYLTSTHGSPPVLLIDDIMGELDLKRRSGFVPLLERSHQAQGQVFMTVTEENWPRELGREVRRWTIRQGAVLPSQGLSWP
jgi:DNA replication and repair protein RecF